MKIKDLIHEMFSSGNLNLEVPNNDTKDFDGNYAELPIDTEILRKKKKKIKMHRRPSTKVLILGDLMKLKDLKRTHYVQINPILLGHIAFEDNIDDPILKEKIKQNPNKYCGRHLGENNWKAINSAVNILLMSLLLISCH